MGYLRLPPRPELAGLLDEVWVQDDPRPAPLAPPTRILPTGRVELVVNYRDPFAVLEGPGERLVPDVSVVGQRTGPLQVRATGATGLVVIGLHPWAAAALLGAEAASLQDRMLPLEDLLGPEVVERLRQRVRECRSAARRGRVAEEVLRDCLDGRQADPVAAEFVRRLGRSGEAGRIGRLAELASLGRRQLHRRIRRAVGLGPKRLARLARSQRAVDLLRRGASAAAVAARCGYSDQAHLSHDLRAFAGCTPAALARASETRLAAHFNHPGATRIYKTVYL